MELNSSDLSNSNGNDDDDGGGCGGGFDGCDGNDGGGGGDSGGAHGGDSGGGAGDSGGYFYYSAQMSRPSFPTTLKRFVIPPTITNPFEREKHHPLSFSQANQQF